MSYAEGIFAEIMLHHHLPNPSGFEFERIVTPDAPQHVFFRLQDLLLDSSARAIFVETVSGKLRGRVFFDAEAPDLVEGTEPPSSSSEIANWSELAGVERVWISPRLAEEIEEERERRKRFEKRDKEYIRIAG